jgi:hypothetical protein
MAIVCGAAANAGSECIKKKLHAFCIVIAISILGKGVVREPVCDPGSSKARESPFQSIEITYLNARPVLLLQPSVGLRHKYA